MRKLNIRKRKLTLTIFLSNMKKEITAKGWREDFHKSGQEVSKVIDEHFEELWKIAAVLQVICDSPIRITTVYGDFTFQPKPIDFEFGLK